MHMVNDISKYFMQGRYFIMAIWKISGTSYEGLTTEDTIFQIIGDKIFCYNKELGYFEHPIIKTFSALADHLDRMSAEGYMVERIF